MSIQNRETALQNEIVRLYFKFLHNGALENPSGQPMVEIIDADGASVITSLPAQIEYRGVYYVDWFVPKNLPLGTYYDRWTFQWTSSSSVQEVVMPIQVRSFDSYINFISAGVAHSVSDRVQQLLLDLKNWFVYETTHIPIYWEQGMRIQQEDQSKRVKDTYHFELTGNSFSASKGAVYFNNAQRFTISEDIVADDESSSSSPVADESSSSSSSDSSPSSSSESSYDQEDFPEPPFVEKTYLTASGTGNPQASGTLHKVSGTGDAMIHYSSYTVKRSKFSSIYNFAYRNWARDWQPIVRVNQRIVEDGWYADYDGRIYFDRMMTPRDNVEVSYKFSCFSQEHLLGFIRFGLDMMNTVPPSSVVYSNLDIMPREWNAPVLLYAATQAMRRAVFALSFQEKAIIFGALDSDNANKVQSMWQSLYQEYSKQWEEVKKDVKTRKLPGMAMSVQPEYTLPGGRCMSADTYIKAIVDDVEHYTTIKNLYDYFVEGKNILVLSYADDKFIYSKVGKIWESGKKLTYVVSDGINKLRLSEEHVVFTVNRGYVCVRDLTSYDYLLVNVDGVPEPRKLIEDPVAHELEPVFDIEVPIVENFVGNNIVSHNSRFFRYLFKTN